MHGKPQNPKIWTIRHPNENKPCMFKKRKIYFLKHEYPTAGVIYLNWLNSGKTFRYNNV